MAKTNSKSKRSQIADLALQIADHQARIQTLAANWGEEINAQLNATEKAFMTKLAKELKNFKFNANAKETLDRLKKITARLNAIRKAAYERAEEKVREEARKLAENEMKWGKRITQELSEPGTRLKDPSPTLLDKVVKFGLADGKTLQEYFSGIADADAVRIESSIRQGVESGWTIDQIARNIAGSAENHYKDGVFETSRKSAVNMARTLCNAVSNNAKDAFYNANSDVISGVEILSTLDGRTCPVCASLDRQRFPLGKPHPALPVHHSCRCVLLPVTPLSDLIEEERPMANSDFMKDAKEAYKKRFPKKDWDSLSDGTKKKYYYEAMRLYEKRTGKPAYTQVSGSVSFRDYFEKHMTDDQRLKWLGPERFKIWKHGNLPLDKFIPPYPDKRLTVEKMKELDKTSFAQNSPISVITRIKPLSKEEVDAVEQYTRSDDYADLNAYLRTGQTGNDYFDRETRLLNSAIDKSELTEDVVVWRGVARAELRDLNIKLDEIELDAFTSTSLSRDIANKFAGRKLDEAVIYKIKLPKGTHAIDAMGISRKPEEREILLPPTGKFNIERVYYEKGSDGKNTRQIVEVTYGF